MAEDLTSFALAFTIVWGGLAAYLLHLHRRQAALAARVEALEGGRRGGG